MSELEHQRKRLDIERVNRLKAEHNIRDAKKQIERLESELYATKLRRKDATSRA